MEPLLSFKKFPVFMGCVDTPIEDDILTDMNWYVSPRSGMIQLNPIVDEKTIYMKPHGSGTIGRTWQNHHEQFSQFVKKTVHGEIIEIGSSHGILYSLLKDQNHKWTIVEPNYFGERTSDVTVVSEFFNSALDLNKKFGTIIHSHMFEHVLNLKEFFDGIVRHIEPDGNMIFSIPNLDHILKDNQNFVLHFEHTYLLIDRYVNDILAMNGFEIVQRQNYNNHSTFYHARYTGRVKTDFDFTGLYEYHVSQALKTYVNIKRDVDYVNSVLSSTSSPCYLFGGHVFTQYLLNLGLKEENFVSILDNDSEKTSKRLYGSKLMVQKPDVLRDVKNPIVILRAGVYREEIAKQLVTINNDCTFY